ncbi:hypothetical protein TNCV_3181801 [Trichonephila clavipes]|nr:hypothetical protein TNCV_3181801 [Trichonephila clavipes]
MGPEIAVVSDFQSEFCLAIILVELRQQTKLPHLELLIPVYVETPFPETTDCLVRFMVWWNPSSKTMPQRSSMVNRAMITNFFTRLMSRSCGSNKMDFFFSHFGPVNWPPRSCDLTPLDYFCGAM